MGIAYRRTVATSAVSNGSPLAPLLSVFGHALIVPLFMTATIAVRDTPRFDDFELFGFAGGEVVEAQVAVMEEPSQEELAPEPILAEETIAPENELLEVAALEEVLTTETIDTASEVSPFDSVAAESEAVPADVVEELAASTDIPLATASLDDAPEAVTSVALQPVALQHEIAAPILAESELATAPSPLAERLAATTLAVDAPTIEAVALIEPIVADEPLPAAKVMMQALSEPKKGPQRLPQRKSAPPETGGQQAVIPPSEPRSTRDSMLARHDPELWQVISALRAQVARCWAAGPASGETASFVDLEVAFDRSGRLDRARVADAGRLLRDGEYLREATRARSALKACSPFVLPSEHYDIWRQFTMRFMLSS